MRKRILIGILSLLIAVILLASCAVPEGTSSQSLDVVYMATLNKYIDDVEGVVCYTYGDSGISCIKR